MTLAELTPQLIKLSPEEKARAVQILTNSLAGVWPGIEKTPGVCGGQARIRSTRITVWLLEGLRRLGSDDAAILKQYPSLSQLDLDNAWAYAAANEAEIDDAIRLNDEA
jgi:uncharacterized protein (DUF433 family)